MINELKEKFGSKCSAININGTIPKINVPAKQMKLCEAVHHSFCIPIQINNKNLGCPGARRSMGFDLDDLKLAKTISQSNDIPISFIYEALNNIPSLNNETIHINLGITQEMEKRLPPDLFIIYVQSFRITEIMHLLAKQGIQPSLSNYSLLSICGNVLANCYCNTLLSASFGCPESRKYGGIEESEVVVGIPANLVKHLLN